MTRRNRAVERRIEEKGYRYYGYFQDGDEAQQKAEELRRDGYYAMALECPTRVNGYYDYCVYVRRKGQ